jgi:hypothetical protein
MTSAVIKVLVPALEDYLEREYTPEAVRRALQSNEFNVKLYKILRKLPLAVFSSKYVSTLSMPATLRDLNELASATVVRCPDVDANLRMECLEVLTRMIDRDSELEYINISKYLTIRQTTLPRDIFGICGVELERLLCVDTSTILDMIENKDFKPYIRWIYVKLREYGITHFSNKAIILYDKWLSGADIFPEVYEPHARKLYMIAANDWFDRLL